MLLWSSQPLPLTSDSTELLNVIFTLWRKKNTLFTTAKSTQSRQPGQWRQDVPVVPTSGFPAQASNFLRLSAGLPPLQESGVDNQPHLWGSWVPSPPSSRPLKSLSVFCRGPLLWPAPLVSISSGDSTDTLKGGSKWISRPKMCWKMPGWRRLPQTRVSWTQILAEVGSRMALVSLQSVQSRPAWWMKTKWFRTKHGAWIQALLSHGDSAWGQVEKLQKGLQRHSSKISALNCPTIFKSTNN